MGYDPILQALEKIELDKPVRVFLGKRKRLIIKKSAQQRAFALTSTKSPDNGKSLWSRGGQESNEATWQVRKKYVQEISSF
jgi:hypothetical protein